MTTHILHRKLPCEHHHVRIDGHGTVRKLCVTCKRAWLAHLVRSPISDRVGSEVLRVVWEEVTA